MFSPKTATHSKGRAMLPKMRLPNNTDPNKNFRKTAIYSARHFLINPGVVYDVVLYKLREPHRYV
jgi:hypothetical protein